MNKIHDSPDDVSSLDLEENLLTIKAVDHESNGLPTDTMSDTVVAEDLTSFNVLSNGEEELSNSSNYPSKHDKGSSHNLINGNEGPATALEKAGSGSSIAKSEKGRVFSRIELQLKKRAEQARR